MIISIPKEILLHEHRVAATPETVTKLIAAGHEVFVETNAGAGSFFMDKQYSDAGATIESDVAALYAKADLILKVKEPQFNDTLKQHEISLMRKGQVLITFLHPASPANHEMVRMLAKQGVIGLTLDGVPRISKAQPLDALTSMSTCAGYKGMLMAMNDLAKFVPQIFSAVGVVKPATVFVIGAGVAGLQAIATAKRLGAIVYATDIRKDACEQAMSLGAKIIDSGIPAEEAVGQGGYAKKLSEAWLEKERVALSDMIAQADIVFLSALIPNKKAPIIMNEALVKSMKPGSVIVDISIDQGGNCSLTKAGNIYVYDGVTIQGIKNIPGHIPTSATWMFAQNMFHLVQYLAPEGKLNLDLNDEIIKEIIVTDGETIVHEGTIEAMDIA